MDTPTLRKAVKQVINYYASFKPSHGDIRLDAVFDEAHDRYALMQVGWSRGQRVRGNLIYITLQEGRVYLEYDGMEQGITQSLLAQGIPTEALVDASLVKTPAVVTS